MPGVAKACLTPERSYRISTSPGLCREDVPRALSLRAEWDSLQPQPQTRGLRATRATSDLDLKCSDRTCFFRFHATGAFITQTQCTEGDWFWRSASGRGGGRWGGHSLCCLPLSCLFPSETGSVTHTGTSWAHSCPPRTVIFSPFNDLPSLCNVGLFPDLLLLQFKSCLAVI